MKTDNGSILKLKNVKVVFKNEGKDGYKPSLVIDATDLSVRATITKWVEENNIGKGEQAGKPHFGVYEPKDNNGNEKQFRYMFRITKRTVFKGLNGLGESDLGYGARVSLVADTYKYSKFGGGVGQSLLAVKVLSASSNSNERYADELMDDDDDEDFGLDDFHEPKNASNEIKEEDIPFN